MYESYNNFKEQLFISILLRIETSSDHKRWIACWAVGQTRDHRG